MTGSPAQGEAGSKPQYMLGSSMEEPHKALPVGVGEHSQSGNWEECPFMPWEDFNLVLPHKSSNWEATPEIGAPSFLLVCVLL